MSRPPQQRTGRRPTRGRRSPENAAAARAARQNVSIAIRFPQELPVSGRKDEIAEAIRDNQVVIIAGETGSGKTTQIPKICLELGRGIDGMIGHTQPRRIAARTVAERIAFELGVSLADGPTPVGYQVRFTSHVAPETRVKVMTDGILLAEVQRDPMLRAYDTIIIDEAHERSLNIDFLLGYLATLLPKRPDLKIIVTSATINPHEFSEHFGGAPIIEVSGRTYPVEMRYRPLDGQAGDDDIDGPGDDGDYEAGQGDQTEGVIAAVDELMKEPDGDILVFLAGEADIRDTADALSAHLRKRGGRAAAYDVLPLFARLSAGEQHKIFARHSRARIVLSTNVAETSLTVPGIKYVIDTGTARISRYSHRTKVQRLPIEWISQASANQRAGRCGRTSDGICIRLYSADAFQSRPEFTDPEVRRTNLASVILQMATLGLADTDDEIAGFPFLTPPDARAIRDGRLMLAELGALVSDKRGHNRLTTLGRDVARLPIDPRLARMLLEGTRRKAGADVAVVVAALAIQDPRERPVEARAEATGKHRRFDDPTSDFLSLLNLWNYVQEQRAELGSSKFRKLCRAEFLNPVRIREWFDLVGQLRAMLREGKHEVGEVTTGDAQLVGDAVHRSILTGLLSQIGSKKVDGNDYQGARGTSFAIFPGSALFKKNPQFIMSAEIVETSRTWARMNAKIDPEWVEAAAGDLVKRSYSEPHWSTKTGQVLAHEKVTLYGVTLIADRRAPFHTVDPVAAREIFIREALVEGNWKADHAFLKHNKEFITRLEELESRTRRRGLVDDYAIFAFYDARVDATAVSARHFESWWKQAKADNPHLLDLTEDAVLDESADVLDDQALDFPTSWPLPDGTSATISYQFSPGSRSDGATIALPVEVLNQVEDEVFTWQVPGLRHDLVTALIRSLPKAVRRHFVPAPDVAADVLDKLEPYSGDVRSALAEELSRRAGIAVRPEDFDLDKIADHLKVNFEIVGQRGKILGRGMDLARLRHDHAGEVRVTISRAAAALERTGITAWDFELPETFTGNAGGRAVTGYPALVDRGENVDLVVLERPDSAAAATWGGIRRLALLAAPDTSSYLAKHLSTAEKLTFATASAGLKGVLADCALAGVDRIMVEFGLDPESPSIPIRTAQQFAPLCAKVRDSHIEKTFDVITLVHRTLATALEIDKGMKKATSLAVLAQLTDIRNHQGKLLAPGFVAETGWLRLQHLPRYMQADLIRLQKLPDNPARDKSLMDRVLAQEAALLRAEGKLKPGTPPGPALVAVRWMIEELRVSLFAQELGTAQPISEKRIAKALAQA